jgi:hypothetical protein
MLILILVVVTAVCFDFTNFHGILKSVIAPAILSPSSASSSPGSARSRSTG